MTNKTRYDAIIAGARCAGASTAMLLARRGARVLVVDPAPPGSDTMSTHALMRGAVIQLHKWGVLDAIRAAGTPPVHQTAFFYGPQVFEIDVRAKGGVDALYAPRRTVLDLALVEAAAASGVEFRFGTGCAGLLWSDNGRVEGMQLRGPDGRIEDVRADLVIGADGRRSAVARHVGARTERTAEHSVACSYAYFEGLPNRGYRWHHVEGAAGGIIPTNDGLSCVFTALRPTDFAGMERGDLAPDRIARSRMPVLAEEIVGARPVTTPVIFRGEPGYFRQSAGPGWALVGDAGYFRDPLTAHGITDALRDAEILADAVIAGHVEAYQKTRDKLSTRFFELTGQIAALDWTLPQLQKLHLDLNTEMKANQAWIVEMASQQAVAA